MNLGGKQRENRLPHPVAQPPGSLHTFARDAKFPFSSPRADERRSNRSSGSGETVATHKPFSSPYPSSIGEESDSASGLDEFHLERYSQDTKRGLSPKANKRIENMNHIRERSESPSKRVRPGLNIITDFSKTKTALGLHAAIDTVPANRPQIGRRSVTSIKSSRVEHGFYHSSRSGEDQPTLSNYGNVKSLQQREKKIQKSKRGRHAVKPSDESVPAETTDRKISPAARSVLIGISVPQAELAAHQHTAGDSALSGHTPRTPSILITPADEDSPWSADSSTLRRRRPASSLYSQQADDLDATASQDVPPVPKIDPSIHNGFAAQYQGMLPGTSNQNKPDVFHGNRESFETVFDDNTPPDAKSTRRASSDSQEQILSSTPDDTRPQSKGWWNLMLSPMLSRAGTLVSKKSLWSPTQESFPTTLQYQQRAAQQMAHEQQPRSFDNNEKDANTPNFHHAASTVQAVNPQTDTIQAGGMAAEYFHGCAVDATCNGQYFECINHSCSEKLPRLAFTPMVENSRGVVEAAPSTPLLRSLNTDLEIEKSPLGVSPHVRQASTAALIKATPIDRALATPRTLTTERNVPSNETGLAPAWPLMTTTSTTSQVTARRITKIPNISTGPASQQAAVPSPGPVTPDIRQTMAPPNAMPMDSISRNGPPSVPGVFIAEEISCPTYPLASDRGPALLRDVNKAPIETIDDIPHGQLERSERGEKPKRRCCGGGCLFRSKDSKKSKHKKVYVGVFVLLLLIIIACVVLAIELTRKGTGTPVQSQWLNLTGFPPMPTGISTIVKPDVANADSSCVQPRPLWSCSLPKEAQWSVSPNDPDQPNFRFEITFRNYTVPINETQLARRLRNVRRQNDPFTNDLFEAAPPTPGIAEQNFLGNTTDNVTFPFDGEQTPFFITFMPTQPHAPAAFVSKRSLSSRESFGDDDADTSIIPPPSTNADGTASPANLLPTIVYPASQPIRLYNRGQATEHYGFYTYFDRSIFLRSNSRSLTSDGAFTSIPAIPGNANGGSPESEASMRCTWSQTRFIVKMWTNSAFGATLLGPQFNVDSPPSKSSSATDFTPPGSFPYPVTITLDRHGGDLHKKGVFCYGVDGSQHIISDQKTLVPEDRSSGGVAINPAPPLISTPGEGNGFDPNAGGIDGGTGGCACSWQNWIG